ncbi:MAG: tetratricopeptide repeat protein [Pirellulales bacterium]
MKLKFGMLQVAGIVAVGLSTQLSAQAPPSPSQPLPTRSDFKNPLGAAVPKPAAPDLLKEAREAVGKRQFDRARELFAAVVRADPTNRDAALEYADTFYAEDRYEESLVEFGKVADAFPRFDKVYHWRGDAYRNLKRFAEAESDYTRALELSPKSSIYLLERAKVRAEQGRHADAIVDVSVALRLTKLDDMRAQLLTARAGFSQRRGDADSALADFVAAANLEPENAGYLNAAAWQLATSPSPERRNAALALEWATRACALTKYENPNYLDTLAAVCAENEQFEQAVALQQTAIELASEAARPAMASRLEMYREKRPLSSRPSDPNENEKTPPAAPSAPEPPQP